MEMNKKKGLKSKTTGNLTMSKYVVGKYRNEFEKVQNWCQ